MLSWAKSRSYRLEKTIVALRIVKDYQTFGSETSEPITKDLTAARKAHLEYQLYFEEQRRQIAADRLHKAV